MKEPYQSPQAAADTYAHSMAVHDAMVDLSKVFIQLASVNRLSSGAIFNRIDGMDWIVSFKSLGSPKRKRSK
jgi:hypothetical protein